MATAKRRKSDWWCLRCRRVLRNQPSHEEPLPRDTVTGDREKGTCTHDGCAGNVQPGRA